MFCKMIAHKENTLSNKTQVLTKSMNVDIWVFDILNQLCMRYILILKLDFQKQVVNGKTPSFVIYPFCTSHSIYPNIGVLTWQICMEIFHFQSFQLRNSIPAFNKDISFLKNFF